MSCLALKPTLVLIPTLLPEPVPKPVPTKKPPESTVCMPFRGLAWQTFVLQIRPLANVAGRLSAVLLATPPVTWYCYQETGGPKKTPPWKGKAMYVSTRAVKNYFVYALPECLSETCYEKCRNFPNDFGRILMGGPGSGYRWDKRDFIEEYPRIYVRELARRGLINSGATAVMSWSQAGEVTASIKVSSESEHVRLSYMVSDRGMDAEPIEQLISLTYTPCHFGGSRPWFVCPECSRRVGVLVGGGRLFWCRHCHQLPYTSQSETRVDRACRRVRKIQKRLGNEDSANVIDRYFPRPKGMHRKTHRRLVRQAESACLAIDNSICSLVSIR